MNRTATLLRELLAFDTSNPPGETRKLAEFLRDCFARLGAEIEPIKAPRPQGPVHFIARLRSDGSRRPVLLAAHADVVPVERALWSVDPFAGVVRNGWVLGRGAMDYKGGLAVFATAAMMLAEQRVPLARYVILLSEGDEEGGPHGTRWLANHHWDRIDAELALNEGSWILQDAAGVARGERRRPGQDHRRAAAGDPRSSPFRLARPRGDDRDRPAGRGTGGARRNRYAAEADRAHTQLSPGVVAHQRPAREAAGRRIVAGGPYPALFHALMRDTLAITMLNGGIKKDVIPGAAEARVNVRLLPGSTLHDAIAHFRAAIGDPAVEITVPAFPTIEEARAMIDARTNAALPPPGPISTGRSTRRRGRSGPRPRWCGRYSRPARTRLPGAFRACRSTASTPTRSTTRP